MTASGMASFRGWLGRQAARPDEIGAFAREFLADPGTGALDSVAAVKRHLRASAKRAGPNEIAVMLEAWREFAGFLQRAGGRMN